MRFLCTLSHQFLSSGVCFLDIRSLPWIFWFGLMRSTVVKSIRSRFRNILICLHLYCFDFCCFGVFSNLDCFYSIYPAKHDKISLMLHYLNSTKTFKNFNSNPKSDSIFNLIAHPLYTFTCKDILFQRRFSQHISWNMTTLLRTHWISSNCSSIRCDCCFFYVF